MTVTARHSKHWFQFIDESSGEWFGYLNQRGEINQKLKGGPYKGINNSGTLTYDMILMSLLKIKETHIKCLLFHTGCFHVPRCLMMCEQILKRLLSWKNPKLWRVQYLNLLTHFVLTSLLSTNTINHGSVLGQNHLK